MCEFGIHIFLFSIFQASMIVLYECLLKKIKTKQFLFLIFFFKTYTENNDNCVDLINKKFKNKKNQVNVFIYFSL